MLTKRNENVILETLYVYGKIKYTHEYMCVSEYTY